FGHFIAAKMAGVRVDEFGIGFPPRLFKKKIGETTYSVNIFPVGGFVKIFGENPDDESTTGKDAKRSFVHKSKWVQAWVVGAGIIFNLFLAWVLISVGFMVGLPFSADDERYGARVEGAALTVTQVTAGSPAEMAGIKSGDRIIALYADGYALENPAVSSTRDFIAAHDELTFAYLRDKEIKTVVMSTKDGIVNGRRAVGISMDNTGTLKLPVHEALYEGGLSTLSFTWMTMKGIAQFFKNMFIGQADFSDVSGPVGIAGIVGDASALGFVHLLSLIAIISINLAVINVLPFPALDGGRLLFIIIETIKGSPIKPSIVNTANGIGFILLIFLMVVVTYSDIAKILHG
ncbi:MAG: M50 family metallopeptidase, partial [Minisyncoccota bacterium]